MNESVVCLLDSARGQYIPKAFAELCNMEEWGISKEEAEILLSGPEHEWYWETWEEVLDSAEYINPAGNKYHLHQDGDLWAYCLERMSLEDQRNLFNPSFISDYYVPDGFTLFEIGEQFLCPLYYVDLSGLTDEEISALDSFIESNGDEVADSIDYDNFGECEITGMKGKTCLVVIRSK